MCRITCRVGDDVRFRGAAAQSREAVSPRVKEGSTASVHNLTSALQSFHFIGLPTSCNLSDSWPHAHRTGATMPLEYYKKAMTANLHVARCMVSEGSRAVIRAKRFESNRIIAKHTQVCTSGPCTCYTENIRAPSVDSAANLASPAGV